MNAEETAWWPYISLRTLYSTHVDLYECPECSAMVSDRVKHEQWHQDTEHSPLATAR